MHSASEPIQRINVDQVDFCRAAQAATAHLHDNVFAATGAQQVLEPMFPNSLLSSSVNIPFGCCSNRFITVVLPLPRRSVRKVSGIWSMASSPSRVSSFLRLCADTDSAACRPRSCGARASCNGRTTPHQLTASSRRACLFGHVATPGWEGIIIFRPHLGAFRHFSIGEQTLIEALAQCQLIHVNTDEHELLTCVTNVRLPIAIDILQ